MKVSEAYNEALGLRDDEYGEMIASAELLKVRLIALCDMPEDRVSITDVAIVRSLMRRLEDSISTYRSARELYEAIRDIEGCLD